jgi:hypothetical protein
MRIPRLLIPVAAVAAVIGFNTSSASAGPLIGGHWAHDGNTRSQIYFVDHTGPNMPVASTVYKWNEAHGVDSYYETSCPNSRLHCVPVYEYTDTSAGAPYGITYISPTDGAGHFTGSESVYLNDGTITNATQERKSTCHEEGHVLGLDHQFTTTSCMMQGNAVQQGISMYPNADDFNTLHNLYNHAN